MTDDPHDSGSDDELLSADIDGETSPSEHARIEADPGLVARRRELRAAADVAGRPPDPLPAGAVDALVARALDTLGAAPLAPPVATSIPPPPTGPPVAPPPPPIPLVRTRRITPLLVAAAVVAVVAIGVGVIVATKSPTKETNTAVRRSDRSAAAPKAVSPTGGGGPPTTAQDSREGPFLGFIGRFSSAAALRTASKIGLPPETHTGASGVRISAGQADRCAGVLEARDPRLRPSGRRTPLSATIAADPVIVYEYEVRSITGDRPTTRVVAVGVAACDERLNFER